MDNHICEQENVKVVQEKKVLVSEVRIKNAIKEYRKSQPLGWLLSSTFACFLSFFTAYASYSGSDSIWKVVFLVLLILSAAGLLIGIVLSIARKKTSHGTEKWLLEEIRDEHIETKKHQLDSKKKKHCIFNFVNIVLIIGLPASTLLIYLACNNWNSYPNEMAMLFWLFWSILSATYLLFGTYVNLLFAGLFFGYERDENF